MKKSRTVTEIASEYRFDYSEAKPNRFAENTKLNMAWTAEMFVGEVKAEKPKAKAKAPAKSKPAKTKASKAKKSAPKKKSSAKTPAKKPMTKKTAKKKKK